MESARRGGGDYWKSRRCGERREEAGRCSILDRAGRRTSVRRRMDAEGGEIRFGLSAAGRAAGLPRSCFILIRLLPHLVWVTAAANVRSALSGRQMRANICQGQQATASTEEPRGGGGGGSATLTPDTLRGIKTRSRKKRGGSRWNFWRRLMRC